VEGKSLASADCAKVERETRERTSYSVGGVTYPRSTFVQPMAPGWDDESWHIQQERESKGDGLKPTREEETENVICGATGATSSARENFKFSQH